MGADTSKSLYVILSTDSLDKQSEGAAGEAAVQGQKTSSNLLAIRRPYRGIQIKNDTYAALSIWSGNTPIPLVSESATSGTEPTVGDGIGLVQYYSDFILQSVTDDRSEKMQVIETFGDPFVYFYGERPRFVTFSGVLVNSEDFNWRSQFWKNYDTYLRGSKLVQMNARAFLSYDSIVVEGYPIQASASDDANQPHLIPFRLTMLVTNYFDYSDVGSVYFPGYGVSQADALSSLNDEMSLLKNNRNAFTSTGSQVRLLNLQAAPASGLLATVQTVMRGLNDIGTIFGGVIDTINNIVGGRVVRMPIGVAGFIAQQGDATVAPGSVDKFEMQMYNAKTGQYGTLTGPLTLLVPGSQDTLGNGAWQDRGRKSDNYDEYPLRPDSPLSKLLSPSQYVDFKLQMAQDQIFAKKTDQQLALYNELAQANGLAGELASVAGMLKSGFGMAMSAVGFVRDPLGVMKSSLGLGNLSSFLSINGLLGTLVDTFTEGSGTPILSDLQKAEMQGITVNPTLAGDKRDVASLITQQNISTRGTAAIQQSSKYARASQTIQNIMQANGITVEPGPYLAALQDNIAMSVTDMTNTAARIRDQLKSSGISELQDTGAMATTATGNLESASTKNNTRADYIGQKAADQNQSFSSVLNDARLKIDLFGDPTAEVDVGTVYSSQSYSPESSQVRDPTDIQTRSQYLTSIDYEAAFASEKQQLGVSDYTSMAARPGVSSVAIKAVKEAFVDTSIDRQTEITEQAIDAVYGTGYQSKVYRTTEQVAAMLRAIYGSDGQLLGYAAGISGIDDDDSDINPVR